MNEIEDLEKYYVYTPEKFYKHANLLVEKIIKDTPESEPFDIVLCIARGGLVLAFYVSSKLNIPIFYTIRLQSYHNMKQNEIEILQEPPWEKMKGKKVLIIEDLIDQGETVKYLFHLLKIHQIKNYKLALLVDKQKNPNVTADYCIVNTKKWVLFFWEEEYAEWKM